MKKLSKFLGILAISAIINAFTGCSGVVSNPDSNQKEHGTIVMYPIEINTANLNFGMVFSYNVGSKTFNASTSLNNVSGYTTPRAGQKVSVNVNLSLNQVSTGVSNVTGSLVFVGKNGNTVKSAPVPIISNQRAPYIPGPDYVINGTIEASCLLNDVQDVELEINFEPDASFAGASLEQQLSTVITAESGEGIPEASDLSGVSSSSDLLALDDYFFITPIPSTLMPSSGSVQAGYRIMINPKYTLGKTEYAYFSVSGVPFNLTIPTSDPNKEIPSFFVYPFTSGADDYDYVTFSGWLSENGGEEKYVKQTYKIEPSVTGINYNDIVKLDKFLASKIEDLDYDRFYDGFTATFNTQITEASDITGDKIYDYFTNYTCSLNIVNYICFDEKDKNRPFDAQCFSYVEAEEDSEIEEVLLNGLVYLYESDEGINWQKTGYNYFAATTLYLILDYRGVAYYYCLDDSLILCSEQQTCNPKDSKYNLDSESFYIKAEPVDQGIKISIDDSVVFDNNSYIMVDGKSVRIYLEDNNKKEYYYPFVKANERLTIRLLAEDVYDAVECVATKSGLDCESLFDVQKILSSKIKDVEYHYDETDFKDSYFSAKLDTVANKVSDFVKNKNALDFFNFSTELYLGRRDYYNEDCAGMPPYSLLVDNGDVILGYAKNGLKYYLNDSFSSEPLDFYEFGRRYFTELLFSFKLKGYKEIFDFVPYSYTEFYKEQPVYDDFVNEKVLADITETLSSFDEIEFSNGRWKCYRSQIMDNDEGYMGTSVEMTAYINNPNFEYTYFKTKEIASDYRMFSSNNSGTVNFDGMNYLLTHVYSQTELDKLNTLGHTSVADLLPTPMILKSVGSIKISKNKAGTKYFIELGKAGENGSGVTKILYAKDENIHQ